VPLLSAAPFFAPPGFHSPGFFLTAALLGELPFTESPQKLGVPQNHICGAPLWGGEPSSKTHIPPPQEWVCPQPHQGLFSPGGTPVPIPTKKRGAQPLTQYPNFPKGPIHSSAQKLNFSPPDGVPVARHSQVPNQVPLGQKHT